MLFVYSLLGITALLIDCCFDCIVSHINQIITVMSLHAIK